jgi:hypothetical protein
MRKLNLLLSSTLVSAVAGCAAAPSTRPVYAPPSGPDALYEPARVEPGRLEYAPDRSTFAPVLTERFPYPTQPQANDAYRRYLAAAPVRARQGSLWLFGCKPGALDSQTARVSRYRGPVVHCATDVLDASGRRVARETVNFYYADRTWNMAVADPPHTPVPWLGGESSPKDMWWWVPGRDRYE